MYDVKNTSTEVADVTEIVHVCVNECEGDWKSDI